MYIVIPLLLAALLSACDGIRADKQAAQDLELRERELALKERELALREAELNQLKAQHHNTAENRSLAEIYVDVKRAVYLVSTTKQFGESQGSAFVIHPSGLAISNYHVFKNASDVIIYNENKDEYLVTEILDYSAENDYILFRIGPNHGDLPYVEIASELPGIGSECFTVGNPKGLSQTLSDGLISAYRENHRILQTTTEITNGSSGGPLFDPNGKVIGITSSGYQKSNLNFAINIQSLPISDYLNENRLSINSMSSYELLNLLTNYYSSLKNEDLDALGHAYNVDLVRYHKLFNINKYQAINDHVNYFKTYRIIKADIIQNSIDIHFNGKAYFVTYQLDWEIIRKKDDHPLNYRLETVVEVHPNGCINSIYDNLLKKK